MKSQDSSSNKKPVCFNLGTSDLEKLDRVRGLASRSAFIRHLINQVTEPKEKQ